MGFSVRGHICIRRKAKDGEPGAAGKSIRTTVWEAGKQYYAGDTQVDGVYPLDIVSDKAMSIGVSGVNFYMCRTSHTSSANIPLTNTAYWTKLNNLKPVVTYLILAELIKANYIDVQDLAASNAFIQTLIAQSAFIDNLEVKHLNSADGIFYGMLQFPFADMIGGTIHQYDDGDNYHYQLAPDRATSLHLKATDRYTGTPYSSGPKYIHLHLPSNVPDGVVVNLISDAYNYKNVVRPFYLHGDIFYETNDEAYWGQSINMASMITYNDIFFIRLMTFAGKWYVIQTLGRADITPAGS